MAFRLPDELTIDSLPDVRDRLLEELQASGTVEVDGADVREVDLAGLQLLCAACRHAGAAGKTIRFAPGRRGAVIEAALVVAGFVRPRSCEKECLCTGGAHG